MSKASSLLTPILAKRRGKNPDKKSWHNLHGSSSSFALYQAAKTAETPILVITSNTPEALKIEQELLSLAKGASQTHDENKASICLFPDWETLPMITFPLIKTLFLNALLPFINYRVWSQALLLCL